MALISLAEAKAHLKITTLDGDPRDANLETKIAMAEAIVLDYIGDEAPDPSDVIRAAVLVQLEELWDANPKGMPQTPGHLSERVTNYLRRKRKIPVA